MFPPAGVMRGWYRAVFAVFIAFGAYPDIAQADYTDVQISNSYIKVVAGVGGTADGAGPGRNSSVKVAGRFVVGTTSGNPLDNNDTNWAISAGFPAPWGIYTIIKVNDTASAIYGDDGPGNFTAPVADSKNLTITDSYTLKNLPIRVDRKLAILRDLVRVEYRVTNTGTTTHKVGLATSIDTEYGLSGGVLPVTGGPFYTLMTGKIENESQLTGAGVPDVIYGFNGLPNFSTVVQALLAGGDATKPDKVVMSQANRSWGDFWAFQPNPLNSILTESALLLFYNQKDLPPGRTSSPYVFYYGLGNATQDASYPLSLALQADFSLSYMRDAGDSVGTIDPDPFTIYGYAYNLSSEIPLENVQVQLTLGGGLEFETGETPIKTIGRINPSEEGVASWQVRADSSEFGPVGYTLTVAGYPLNAKSVTRTINIPATEQRTFFKDVWEMISLPFQPDSSDLASTLNQSGSSFYAVRYNPLLNAYEDDFVADAGTGFWFRPLTGDSEGYFDVTLHDVNPIGDSSTLPRLVPLQKGWNQVGNPYLYGLFWGRFRFLKDPEEGSISLSEAITRNWVRATIYWYDIYSGEYNYSSSLSTVLKPWYSYWIRALQPVTLLVPPSDIIGGGVSASSVASLKPVFQNNAGDAPVSSMGRFGVRTGGQDWTLKIGIASQDRRDSVAVGCSSKAEDGYDLLDVDKPPPTSVLMLSVINSGWGENSGRYSKDIKALGLTKTWNLEAIIGKSRSPVTVTWDLTDVAGKGVSLTLYDTVENRSIRMNSGGSYTFRLRAGETARNFRVIAHASVARRAR